MFIIINAMTGKFVSEEIHFGHSKGYTKYYLPLDGPPWLCNPHSIPPTRITGWVLKWSAQFFLWRYKRKYHKATGRRVMPEELIILDSKKDLLELPKGLPFHMHMVYHYLNAHR